MANRILIGNRATGGQGLYVSQDGDNVLTTTNAMQFDSRMAASAIVHSFAQGTVSGNSVADITHNLGYTPAFAVRWNYVTELSGGVATQVYSPCITDSVTEEGFGEGFDGGIQWGLSAGHSSVNNIRITNFHETTGDFGTHYAAVYYAIVIFHQEDFTGGQGL
tara:strand:- start:2055 stop:2543 length:489 start_codon:yes stop_codon:yes gene_type:complete